jgi:hypothetical protein
MMSSTLKDGAIPIPVSWLILEIEKLSSQLASVNDGNELTPEYKFNVNNCPKLFRFEQSFRDSSLILRRDEQRCTPVSTSTSTPMFTTPDQQFAIPDAAVFRTPEQDQQVLLERMSVGKDSLHSTESNRSANQSIILQPSQINFSERPIIRWKHFLTKRHGSTVQVDLVLCIIPDSESLLILIQNGTNNGNQCWKVKSNCKI